MANRAIANRSRNREILLLYNFRGTEIGQRLHGVAARMGILCKVIEEEQMDERIGALLKIPGIPSTAQVPAEIPEVLKDENGEGESPVTDYSGQMMILFGFTSTRLDSFLSNSRRAGNPIIPLKAMVTPENAGWTCRQLYDELKREDEYRKSMMEKKAEASEE